MSPVTQEEFHSTASLCSRESYLITGFGIQCLAVIIGNMMRGTARLHSIVVYASEDAGFLHRDETRDELQIPGNDRETANPRVILPRRMRAKGE